MYVLNNVIISFEVTTTFVFVSTPLQSYLFISYTSFLSVCFYINRYCNKYMYIYTCNSVQSVYSKYQLCSSQPNPMKWQVLQIVSTTWFGRFFTPKDIFLWSSNESIETVFSARILFLISVSLRSKSVFSRTILQLFCSLISSRRRPLIFIFISFFSSLRSNKQYVYSFSRQVIIFLKETLLFMVYCYLRRTSTLIQYQKRQSPRATCLGCYGNANCLSS